MLRAKAYERVFAHSLYRYSLGESGWSRGRGADQSGEHGVSEDVQYCPATRGDRHEEGRGIGVGTPFSRPGYFSAAVTGPGGGR
jgi:hypothetical protein